MRSRYLTALVAATGLASLVLLAACGHSHRHTGKQVIVLGFDGMDWGLTQQMVADGRLPNFERLAREGVGQKLETTAPPLSPVAWSNVITGMDSGGNGIFDFMHRDPERLIPIFSMSRPIEAKTISLGPIKIPISSGGDELLLHGEPFWAPLERAGVETWIYRMPVNFPPSGLATRELSGMGTPDLLGTYGTFEFLTTALFPPEGGAGGDVEPMDLWEDRAEGELVGPKLGDEKLRVPLTVYFDPVEPVAEISVGDEKKVLRVGEWSDWMPVTFPLPGMGSDLPATVRFYLRSVRPEVELYCSPLQIDPMDPVRVISTPEDYAEQLAEENGRYFTQGMPEDTKMATLGVFDIDEFLAQAEVAGREIEEMWYRILPQFEDGLVFYYFGRTDQVSHIVWGLTDPQHPKYTPETAARYADVVPKLYEEADKIVGWTLEHMPPEATLIVMSDHGFASYRRTFNLESWLRDNGYLAVKDPNRKDPGLLLNVDWSRTRAYGAGFNGLYLNVRGREKNGIVDPAEADALLAEIGEKLLATIDPKTGGPAVTRVYPSKQFYTDRGALDIGPDMVVGYAKGTRSSDDGVVGEITPEVFGDNLGNWTGDHSMDHTTVPGILFANQTLPRPVVELKDLPEAILAEFGVSGFPRRDESQ